MVYYVDLNVGGWCQHIHDNEHTHSTGLGPYGETTVAIVIEFSSEAAYDVADCINFRSLTALIQKYLDQSDDPYERCLEIDCRPEPIQFFKEKPKNRRIIVHP